MYILLKIISANISRTVRDRAISEVIFDPNGYLQHSRAYIQNFHILAAIVGFFVFLKIINIS